MLRGFISLGVPVDTPVPSRSSEMPKIMSPPDALANEEMSYRNSALSSAVPIMSFSLYSSVLRSEVFSSTNLKISSLLMSSNRTGSIQHLLPMVRETEAEAIAFVVSQIIGLDAGNAAADYIHLYNGNAALLAESLEVIQRTSALILSSKQTPAVTAEQAGAEDDPDPALAQAS